jgi:hypothetical protein
MASDSTGEAPVHPGPSKGLIFLVKAMGLVLVLLFLALIGGIIWKATHKTTPVPTTESLTLDLGINPATIRNMALDGNMLAVTTDKELVVIDIKQRKVLLRSVK